MVSRRSFFTALAALPIVGRWVKKPAPDEPFSACGYCINTTGIPTRFVSIDEILADPQYSESGKRRIREAFASTKFTPPLKESPRA